MPDQAKGRPARIINEALWRPETVAGAEKKPLGLVVTLGVFFGMCAWVYLSVVALVASLTCLLVGVPLLRRLAKADPQMFAVYRANMGHAEHYPARTPAHVRVRGGG